MAHASDESLNRAIVFAARPHPHLEYTTLAQLGIFIALRYNGKQISMGR